MSGIGHNSGRVLEPGKSWRTHVWKKARTELLPKLPIEVVRLRVRRAKELGLPYKTYAGIRASTGHDLVGFLFSSNALRGWEDGQELPKDRIEKLAEISNARKIAIVQRPCNPTSFVPPLDSAFTAPVVLKSWSETRDALKRMIAKEAPADRFLLIGDSAEERIWAEAAQTAGYLSADAYFN